MNEPTELPPHSEEHEAALLGAIIREAEESNSNELLGKLGESLKSRYAFFDLRHQAIYQAAQDLDLRGKTATTIGIWQEIKDTKKTKEVDHAYIISLIDKGAVFGAEDQSLEIVFDKWMARQAIRMGSEWSEQIHDKGIDEAKLSEMSTDLEGLTAAASNFLGGHPRCLKTPMDFEQGFLDHWMRKDEDFGRDLWFGFPLRIRPSESTLFTGDSGSGKSSFLSQLTIHLAMQGAKIMVASMEMAAATTLWLMSRQLIGTNRLPTQEEDGKETFTPESMQKLGSSLLWLQDKVWIYDFQGITDWREILDTARFANEKNGVDILIVDSVMRIGIADDDYAQQGLAAARFSNFSVKHGVHTFLVVHENKGDGANVKNRVRGSKQWTDNAFNVVGMSRNQKKSEKMAEIQAQVDCGEIDRDEGDEKRGELRTMSDSKFVLAKQRWPASRQNASKHLWFDLPSCQFREKPDGDPSIDLLAKYKRMRKAKSE